MRSRGFVLFGLLFGLRPGGSGSPSRPTHQVCIEAQGVARVRDHNLARSLGCPKRLRSCIVDQLLVLVIASRGDPLDHERLREQTLGGPFAEKLQSNTLLFAKYMYILPPMLVRPAATTGPRRYPPRSTSSVCSTSPTYARAAAMDEQHIGARFPLATNRRTSEGPASTCRIRPTFRSHTY